MKTLKLMLTAVIMLFVTINIYAQSVTIGDREFTAHPSAILEMQSTNKGILVPRLTFTQRMYVQTNAQAAGLLVYQTDRENGFYYFDGLVWKFLAPETTHELPNLARVALSGNYDDLNNKPFIPTELRHLQQDDWFAMYVTREEKQRWNAASAGTTFSGSWNDLTNKPTIPTRLSELQQDSDNRTMTDAEKTKLASLSNSSFSGSWNDLRDKPFIPTELRHLQQDDWWAMYVTRAEKDRWNAASVFSGSWNDLQDRPVLFSGNWNDLFGRPNFHNVATSGNYEDLQNKPTIPTRLSELQQDSDNRTMTDAEKTKLASIPNTLFSGSWNDLRDKPFIPTELRHLEQDNFWAMYVNRMEKETWNAKSDFSGRWQDLQNVPEFHRVATSGNYDDLHGKPFIPTRLLDLQEDPNYAMLVTRSEKERWNHTAQVNLFSGSWNDLADKPDLSRVAFSGDYNDLFGRPTIPRGLEDLTQSNFFRTVTDTEKEMWNNKSNFSGRYTDLVALPDFHRIATSGMYEDLIGKPTIPRSFAELTTDQFNQRVSAADMLRWDNKSNFSGNWQDLFGRPNFHNVATSGNYEDLQNRPNFSTASLTGNYSDLLGVPEWGTWSEITPLEIGTSATVQNSGSISKFARIDHQHTIINSVPSQNIGTNNQTIVNTAMLHHVLTTGFGSTDAMSTGRGDIISGGYETGSTRYMLNIRPNVILSGRPRLENTPDYTDRTTIDYIASTRLLAQEIAALRVELTNARTQAFDRHFPIGSIIMWNGTAANVPNCWEIFDEIAGRFPVGVRSSGGLYTVGETGGANEIILTESQIPPHSHTITAMASGTQAGYTTHNTGSASHAMSNRPLTTGNAGGGEAHENRPPFYGVYFIRKTSNNCQ